MEEKIKKLLVEEFDNMKRIVPWDGMYDSLIKKLIKLFDEEKNGNIQKVHNWV